MKEDVVVPVLASVVGVLGALLIAVALFWIIKSRRKLTQKSQLVPVEIKPRRFTFREVVKMTHNFQQVIGGGGFGTVYHGHLDGGSVAVKLYRGYHQGFQIEMNYLTQFYHKNLINLVGYCDEESERLMLVFEFMANGDLKKNLIESASTNLTWERRLGIAIDMAKALDYLHDGCEQPVIHRDFNSLNILLSENFEVKLSGFASSVTLPVDNDVSTVLLGTPGYVDPEYYVTSQMTIGSDVFGFGVVLMEIITGKSAVQRSEDQEPYHLTNWVSSMFANGEVEGIVDPKLEGEFDVYSAEDALKIAMTCVSENSHDRPAMDQLIVKLKHCLQMERDRLNESVSFNTITSIEIV